MFVLNPYTHVATLFVGEVLGSDTRYLCIIVLFVLVICMYFKHVNKHTCSIIIINPQLLTPKSRL